MVNNPRHAMWVYAALIALALTGGCRSDRRHHPEPRTIVIRDLAEPVRTPTYAADGRAPERIEVLIDRETGASSAHASPLAALVGREVRIQFRRDALGAAAPAPVPPTGQGPGGRAVHLAGIIRSTTGDWLVLERGETDYIIPHDSILLIEVPNGATTSPARK